MKLDYSLNVLCPDLDGVLPSPFTSRGLVPGAIRLVDMGDFGDKRVVRVGVCQHRADGQKYWEHCVISFASTVWKAALPQRRVTNL